MPQPQVGNWTPYKNNSGKAPPDPPPVGRAPRAGFESPRFATVGPKQITPPAGGYQSIISTAAPFDASRQRQITAVTNPFTSGKQDAGNASRAAFARGVTDTSKNSLNRAASQFNVDFQRQSEKSRSEDILAQRQSAADRYRMDVFKDIFDVDTDTRYTQGIMDARQMFETEKRNEETKRTAMMLRMLGSLL
jgi:hypothetical protein